MRISDWSSDVCSSDLDGSPPTNWQSVFGGPAWTWDARRGQYYLHNFLGSQPQLNVHNPEVQDALLGAVRFWLERGVDGRSEARRVGKEGVSTCRSRWSPDH